MKTPCLWRKELINLPNWTTPPPPTTNRGTPPPPPASDQGTPPPSPARGITLPPSPPAPACPSSPPPPPPCQQQRKTAAAAPVAPARRSTPPPSPPRKQRRMTAAAAPAAPASSSTARVGRQYKFGPSLKPLEKLPYERIVEGTTKIVQAEVRDFFEVVKAKKHPPPKEKIDPLKAKHTVAALKKPPPSPSKNNYERITKKSYIETERSGSTISDRRLA